MNTDLVQVVDGSRWTTSLIVAEKFGKRHADVIRAIENLECSQEFTERNFALTSYVDSTGRSLKSYRLTRDGFMMIAMGFTGKKAVAWKEKFIAAFNDATKPLSWIAARAEGKLVRQIVTDVFQIFVDYARAQGSQSPEKYYINFSKMLNDALLDIDGPKPKNVRDLLNVTQLHLIAAAETALARSINEQMSKQVPYKQIYQNAKQRVHAFAETVGRSRIGATERQTMGLIA